MCASFVQEIVTDEVVASCWFFLMIHFVEMVLLPILCVFVPHLWPICAGDGG